jgi:serine/threonine protein kinase
VNLTCYFRVKLAKDKEGNKVALKISAFTEKDGDEKADDILNNEIKAMKALDHPHILKVLDYCGKSQTTTIHGSKVDVSYIALEYATEGELFT